MFGLNVKNLDYCRVGGTIYSYFGATGMFVLSIHAILTKLLSMLTTPS